MLPSDSTSSRDHSLTSTAFCDWPALTASDYTMITALTASDACQPDFDFEWKQENPIPEYLISFVDDNVLDGRCRLQG